MAATIKVQNVSEVIQFCAKVGETGGPAVLRPILERGAETFAAAVRAEVPVDTGAMRDAVQAVLARNESIAKAYTTFDVARAIDERNAKRKSSNRAQVDNKARYPFMVLAGTGPHVIRARNGKALLIAGGKLLKEVQHPGAGSRPAVDRAFRAARSRVADQLERDTAAAFLELKARYGAV
jgi:hypothetical protein